MSSDASELRSFGIELGRIGPKVEKKVDAVLKRGANNVKDTMRDDFQSSRHFSQVGRTINYDITKTSDGIEAEIGPNKYYRSGRLANIAYFGGSRGGGGTVDVENGLRKEEPNFVENIKRVMDDVL